MAVSVGMFIPRGVGDPRQFGPPSHKAIVRYGQRADELGFDSLWVPDHFFIERPKGVLTPYPEAWTTMTALALSTRRARVGSMVLAAGFRHPALLAKMAAALQELSGGRLLLGLGAGNQPKEHAAFGLNFEHRIGAFKEYLPILTGLLAGETVTLEGRYYTVREGSLRTVVPSLPLWIASGGPQMFDLTARFASGWNMAGGGLERAGAQAKFDAFAAACRSAGRSVEDFDVCKMTFMGIATDSAGVRLMVDELAEKARLTPDALQARTLVGTPDQIAAWLSTLTEIGVNHHICQVSDSDQWPNYTDALELLAREVIPRVRSRQ